MKKIIAVFLALVVLGSTGIAYAGGNGSIKSHGKNVSQNVSKSNASKSNGSKSKAAEWQEKKAELKELVATIKENNVQIKDLRDSARDKIKQVQAKVKALKKDPDRISSKKLAEITEKLALIRGDRSALSGTIGKVNGNGLKLKNSKKNQDFTAAKEALNTIISIQKQRIQSLKEVNHDLDDLLSEL